MIMNRLAKTAVVAGVGAAVYGGAYLETKSIFDNPAEHNQKVATCSSGLGDIAIRSNNIPEGCGDFTDSIPAFEFKGRTVYLLPPKELFAAQNIITPKDAIHDRRDEKIYDGIAGVVGMGVMALGLREKRPRKVRHPEIAGNA